MGIITSLCIRGPGVIFHQGLHQVSKRWPAWANSPLVMAAPQCLKLCGFRNWTTPSSNPALPLRRVRNHSPSASGQWKHLSALSLTPFLSATTFSLRETVKHCAPLVTQEQPFWYSHIGISCHTRSHGNTWEREALLIPFLVKNVTILSNISLGPSSAPIWFPRVLSWSCSAPLQAVHTNASRYYLLCCFIMGIFFSAVSCSLPKAIIISQWRHV